MSASCVGKTRDRAMPEGMPLRQVASERDVFLRIIISFQLVVGA